MMDMSSNIIMTMYDLCVYDMVGLRTRVYAFLIILLSFIVEQSNFGATLTLVCRGYATKSWNTTGSETRYTKPYLDAAGC